LGTTTLQAKRFAQAIFEIAQEKGDFEKWLSDLERMEKLAHLDKLVPIIENPRFSFEQKIGLIAPEFQFLDSLPANFLKLLIYQNKFNLLPDILNEFQDLFDLHMGIQKAIVTTAIELDEIEKNTILNNLEVLTGKKVNMSLNVDPDIVGGIIIEMGGKLIDGSTYSRLNILKNDMIGTKR
jgi:F-type H+-transporting ATPase subunit delta